VSSKLICSSGCKYIMLICMTVLESLCIGGEGEYELRLAKKVIDELPKVRSTSVIGQKIIGWILEKVIIIQSPRLDRMLDGCRSQR
jgi:hypothetical protein